MWKKVLMVVILFAICLGIQPKDAKRIEVDLVYVVDGDTMYFIENGQEGKYRLLMVDTPEATTKTEPLGEEATLYTQQLLENASLIEVEYQMDNEVEDQYGRRLVWVFVDGELLQKKLASAGYVEANLYDNGGYYTYKSEIKKALNEAKKNQIGLYK